MTAPDHMEPFTARLRLLGRFDDPPALVAAFLEEVARRCDFAGASVIGHLKAHARTAAGPFHCNLTSIRSGARCAGPLAEHVTCADAVDLDLAVLAYGVPRDQVAALVEAAVEQLRERGLTAWTRDADAGSRPVRGLPRDGDDHTDHDH